MRHPAVSVVLEWFRASGAKTRKRLDGLVDQFARQMGATGERLAELQQEAWHDWSEGERILGRTPTGGENKSHLTDG